MAKKEIRRAARQSQRQHAEAKAQARRDRKPSWRRSLITAAVLAVLWLGISRVLVPGDRPFLTDLIWAAIFFVFYVVFVYYWESFLYRRKIRRRQAGKR
jgi:hypothetical protein